MHRAPSFTYPLRLMGMICNLLLIVCSLTACNLTSPTPVPADNTLSAQSTPQTSLWGEVLPVADAALWGTPRFWRHGENQRFLWVDAVDASIHGRVNSSTPAQKIDLATTLPWHLKVVDNTTSSEHILWIDRYDETGNRLYAAVIDDEFNIIRGGLPISDRAMYHYSVSESDRGNVWVVWSGGEQPETGLYVQTLDPGGRFRIPERMISDADFPYLMGYADRSMVMYWIRPSTQTVYRTPLMNGEIVENQNLSLQIRPDTGFTLTNFQAAADRTHDYLLWTFSDGAQTVSWYSTSLRGTNAWAAPRQLAFTVENTLVETGFNSGQVFAAKDDRTVPPVANASMLQGEWDSVPVVGQRDDSLTIIYLKNGAFYGAQDIVSLDAPLIEFPQLVADRERHLYLTWAELDSTSGQSRIKFTSTRASGS